MFILQSKIKFDISSESDDSNEISKFSSFEK